MRGESEAAFALGRAARQLIDLAGQFARTGVPESAASF